MPFTRGVPVVAIGMDATSASKMIVTSSYGCSVDTCRLPNTLKLMSNTVYNTNTRMKTMSMGEHLPASVWLARRRGYARGSLPFQSKKGAQVAPFVFRPSHRFHAALCPPEVANNQGR